MDEISDVASSINSNGYTKAIALWVHNQISLDATSHRAYYRTRLNPRAVESYQYGIPGPKACEKDARFRRFAFTYMDVEISRGSRSDADNRGHPYTPMVIENNAGIGYTIIKFGGDVRTVLSSPLEYVDASDALNVNTAILQDGSVSSCLLLLLHMLSAHA